MPFPSAITNTQKTNLRAERYQSRTFLALNPNAIVGSARVNQTVFPSSIPQVTFDMGTTMTNALIGQTVLISRTSDMRDAYFRGRVRKAVSGTASAGTLFINQTSVNIQFDDYIWVLNDVALHPKLPYTDGSGNVFIDYDITYRALLPLINGLQSAYVITLNSTPQADLALAPTALATTQGASISSWSWSAPSASFVVGNSSTQNVTLRWTSAGVYWVRLTVTDSGGRANFMTFPVFVCSADYSDSFIQTGLENVTINADETGYTCNVNAFDGVENVLDQTLAVVFSVEKINTSTTPIVSNVNFIGRLRNNNVNTLSDPTYVRLSETGITIEGIGAQLARVPVLSWSSLNELSPNEWGEIAVLTVWRMLSFIASDLCTLSNVASIGFDITDNNYQAYVMPIQEGNILDSMLFLADTINARPAYTAQGEIRIARSARFLSPLAREALTTVMDFTTADMQTLNITYDPVLLVGRALAYGGSFNVSTRGTEYYLAIAPAVAQSDGANQSEVNSQILVAGGQLSTAQAEIGERIANDFAQRNPIPKISTLLHDGFHFLQPNSFQWYTFTIGATDNNRGIVYTTAQRWLLEEISARYDNATGTWDVNATFAQETQGGAYQSVSQIAPAEIPFTLNPYPIQDAYPNYPDDSPFAPEENPSPEDTPPVTKEDVQPIQNPVPENPVAQASKGGDVVAVWNGSNVWVSTNYTQTNSPNWKLIFSGSGITDFKFGAGNHAYIISNDGTDSTFYRTSNVFADGVQWLGTALTGVYELIRTTETAGALYCLSNENPLWSHTFDFTTGDNGFTTRLASASIRTSEGWISSGLIFSGGGGYKESGCTRNAISLGTSTLTGVRVNYYAGVPKNTSGVWTWRLDVNASSYTLPDGTGSLSYFTSVSIVTSVNLSAFLHFTASQPNNNGRIVSITLSGIGVNPFGGSSTQFVTSYSTNHGASFASPVTVGDAPPALAGFDTQRIGTLVFAGADELVRQASAGGAYSDTTNGDTTGSYPALIRTYGQSGTNLIIGSGASISGDTLWRVSGGKTAITPNDGSFNGLVVSPNCVDMWITDNNKIVGIFNFGGTLKLAYSNNAGNSWSFVTSNIVSSSTYLRVRQADAQKRQIYSIQSQLCLYSSDGGATIQTKTAPGASLIGIEVK